MGGCRRWASRTAAPSTSPHQRIGGAPCTLLSGDGKFITLNHRFINIVFQNYFVGSIKHFFRGAAKDKTKEVTDVAQDKVEEVKEAGAL